MDYLSLRRFLLRNVGTARQLSMWDKWLGQAYGLGYITHAGHRQLKLYRATKIVV